MSTAKAPRVLVLHGYEALFVTRNMLELTLAPVQTLPKRQSIR